MAGCYVTDFGILFDSSRSEELLFNDGHLNAKFWCDDLALEQLPYTSPNFGFQIHSNDTVSHACIRPNARDVTEIELAI